MYPDTPQIEDVFDEDDLTEELEDDDFKDGPPLDLYEISNCCNLGLVTALLWKDETGKVVFPTNEYGECFVDFVAGFPLRGSTMSLVAMTAQTYRRTIGKVINKDAEGFILKFKANLSDSRKLDIIESVLCDIVLAIDRHNPSKRQAPNSQFCNASTHAGLPQGIIVSHRTR